MKSWWRYGVGMVVTLLGLLAAAGLFVLHSGLFVIVPLLVILLIAAVVSVKGSGQFRSVFAHYFGSRSSHDPAGRSVMGRLYYSEGRGFGLTRLTADRNGIEVRVLVGLVGTFWFPLPDIVELETRRPSLQAGPLPGLRWSAKGSPSLTFTPWFGDVEALVVALGAGHAYGNTS